MLYSYKRILYDDARNQHVVVDMMKCIFIGIWLLNSEDNGRRSEFIVWRVTSR